MSAIPRCLAQEFLYVMGAVKKKKLKNLTIKGDWNNNKLVMHRVKAEEYKNHRYKDQPCP